MGTFGLKSKPIIPSGITKIPQKALLNGFFVDLTGCCGDNIRSKQPLRSLKMGLID
jgi:hypothetical protein